TIRTARFLCEELEPRLAPATNLGTLDPGRLYLPDQTIPGSLSGAGEAKYTFTVPDAHVNIYSSFNILLEEPQSRIRMVLEGVTSTADPGGNAFSESQLISVDLAAGTYTLDVENPGAFDRSKTLAI